MPTLTEKVEENRRIDKLFFKVNIGKKEKRVGWQNFLLKLDPDDGKAIAIHSHVNMHKFRADLNMFLLFIVG